MDPLSIAMIGSTALSGLGSLFGGNRAAKAAEKAAQLQYDLQLKAMNNAKEAGAKYQTDVTGYADNYNPYIEGGQRASNQLYDLLGLNGQDAGDAARASFTSSPGQGYLMEQGVQALDRSAAARGQLNSGRQSKDLLRFGTGLAQQDYRNYVNDLSGLGNQGFSATGAKTNTLTQGAGGALQGGTLGAQMGFQSANTLPQGMIASANAQNQGMQGALGALNYGVGQFQGQDQLSKLLGNTSRGSSFGGNFAQSGSPFAFGSGGYFGAGPFQP